MKQSLTGIFASQAFASVREAKNASQERRFDAEVSSSVIAQMLLGLSLEGAANEIADQVLLKWPSEKLEQASTPLKWWVLSGLKGRVAFEASAEPLQTVSEIFKIRNVLAHPKVHDFGDETIIQDINGEIQRNVPGDQLVRPGDILATTTIKLMEDHQYNYRHSLSLLKRSIAAIITLRDHVTVAGFVWADQLRSIIPHVLEGV